jgi:hypothetical protein
MSTGYLWHEIFGWHDTGTGTLLPADPFTGHQPIAYHVAHPDKRRRVSLTITRWPLARDHPRGQ